MDVRLFEHVPVLLSQSAAKFELAWENAVFSQPAELDVAVQHDHFVPGLGHHVGQGHAGRSSPDDDDCMCCR
jgi:hypothetical protein